MGPPEILKYLHVSLLAQNVTETAHDVLPDARTVFS